MIDIDKIKKTRIIVSHENCADGIASMLILHDVLREARLVSVTYGRARDELPAGPGMLFCDMTPPEARVAEFVAAGAIVLDHHRGARHVVEAFGADGVFADETAEPGVSGAMLAFREAWLPIYVATDKTKTLLDFTRDGAEHLARLAGIRDTWQRGDWLWRAACAQAAALLFYPQESWFGSDGAHHRDESEIDGRLAIGETLLARGEEEDRKTIAEAFRFTVGGVRVVCFNDLRTSDISEALAGEADLVLGFHYLCDPAPKMVVSCRSRGGFSALDFAKAHGGGGHTQAAGFTVASFGGVDPYSLLRRWVADFVDGAR